MGIHVDKLDKLAEIWSTTRNACKGKKNFVKDVTFNKALYFTGPFDNKYNDEGIHLPQPTKFSICNFGTIYR